MFEWTYTITLNNKLLTKRMEREVKKSMKVALHGVLLFWKRKYLKLHFMRAAYALYFRVYKKRKKKGDPLVESGNLKNQILGQPANIKGTASRATMRLSLGRPSQYKGQLLRRKVLFLIIGLRSQGLTVNYKQAEAMVLQTAGYSPKLKKIFQERLSHISEKEQQEMAKKIHAILTEDFKLRTGRAEKFVLK